VRRPTCVEYVVDVLKEAFLLHLVVAEQEDSRLASTARLQPPTNTRLYCASIEGFALLTDETETAEALLQAAMLPVQEGRRTVVATNLYQHFLDVFTPLGHVVALGDLNGEQLVLGHEG
jgi:hypothetical protein